MTEKDNKAYMYVVECADGTLYTGYTTDVERRLKTHNAGKGAKYTRARLPVKLLYSQACQSKSRRINGGHEWEVVTGGSISLGAKPRRISIVSKTHE